MITRDPKKFMIGTFGIASIIIGVLKKDLIFFIVSTYCLILIQDLEIRRMQKRIKKLEIAILEVALRQ